VLLNLTEYPCFEACTPPAIVDCYNVGYALIGQVMGMG
jgi:hypothetical protein